MVEAELVFGGLEGVLGGPTMPFDGDKSLDRGVGRAPGAGVGQLAIRSVTPDQQAARPQSLGTVHVFVGSERGEQAGNTRTR